MRKIYYFLCLKVIYDGREFYSQGVHALNYGKVADIIAEDEAIRVHAEEQAKTQYDDLDEDQPQEGIYFFEGMQFAVSVYKAEQVTEAEYNTLNKLL